MGQEENRLQQQSCPTSTLSSNTSAEWWSDTAHNVLAPTYENLQLPIPCEGLSRIQGSVCVQHSQWVYQALYWTAREIGSGTAQLQYGTSYAAQRHYNPLYQSLIHELDHQGSKQYSASFYKGHLESKERFAIQRYLLIIGKKKNMQVLWHTFTHFST